jgi:xylulokinase
MACVIGIDIGTTSTVGILVRLPDQVLGLASRPVTLTSRQPGWAEENPEDWWQNLCAITRELLARGDAQRGEIAGVGIAGMLPAVVVLDQHGRCLRPSIQQSDGRCTREVEELRAELDESAFIDIAGNGINQQLVAGKLRWIERHEPEVFARIETVFGSYDYINWRLTGERRIEQNWALEAGLVDLRHHRVADELVAHTHLPLSAFPPMARSTEIVGNVSRKAAEETGLPVGLPVVGGAADLVASALAAGLVNPGEVLLKFGGSIDLLVATDRIAPDRRMFLDYHLVPGLYLPNGCMATGGSGLNWFASSFASGEKTAAEAAGLSLLQHLDHLAERVEAGAGGVGILPYFLGEKTPIHDSLARGAITGLSLSHTIGHLWRALLEAYAYAIAHHIEVFRDMGHRVSHYTACDGGAASRIWMQIVADVLGQPVQLLEGHPGSCLGAAWTAAVSVGLADLSGIGRFVRKGDLIRPSGRNTTIYASGYRAFRETYRRLSEPNRSGSSASFRRP